MSNINVETKTPKGAPQITESLTPAASAGYKRGLAVVYTTGTDGQGCTLVAAAGGAIAGLLEEDVVAGLPAKVVEAGQTVAQIGAAVTAGQELAVNATAQLVPAVSGNVIVAVAQSGNPNAGDYICVLLTPGGAVHA
jgi:hypothetical protein